MSEYRQYELDCITVSLRNNTLLLVFIEEILKEFDPAHGVHNCGPVPGCAGAINLVKCKLYNISKAHAVNDFFFLDLSVFGKWHFHKEGF